MARKNKGNKMEKYIKTLRQYTLISDINNFPKKFISSKIRTKIIKKLNLPSNNKNIKQNQGSEICRLYLIYIYIKESADFFIYYILYIQSKCHVE